MEENYNGIQDFGTEEQKAKVFKMEELVSSSAVVTLQPTSPSLWKIWPRRNQVNQSSCVYHARAKAAGILREQATGEFVEYSASDYNKRSNRPADGSIPIEAFDYWAKFGIGLEALEPSNEINATELEKVKQDKFDVEVASLSKLDKKFVSLRAYDFDYIIATLKATGKPIPLGFFGTVNEWNRDVPVILGPVYLNQASLRHEVCATPNFGIFGGEEGFTIEDSWGTTGIEGKGVRWITRSFFEKRNYIPGLVPTSFKTYEQIDVKPEKPKINLTRDLEYGMTGEDVFELQQVYKYEGFFPANHSGSENFLEITQRCTQEYQTKYGIVSSGTPTTTGFGRVGPKTREHINSRYK